MLLWKIPGKSWVSIQHKLHLHFLFPLGYEEPLQADFPNCTQILRSFPTFQIWQAKFLSNPNHPVKESLFQCFDYSSISYYSEKCVYNECNSIVTVDVATILNVLNISMYQKLLTWIFIHKYNKTWWNKIDNQHFL